MKASYWFKHDSNSRQDPSIVEMINDYGLVGYGWFWCIVETMRDQHDYYCEFSKLGSICEKTRETPEEITKYINDCIDKYHLFTKDGDKFMSPSLLRRMRKWDMRSEQCREAADKRWKHPKKSRAIIKEPFTPEYDAWWESYKSHWKTANAKVPCYKLWRALSDEEKKSLVIATEIYCSENSKENHKFCKKPKEFLADGFWKSWVREQKPKNSFKI